MPNEDPIETLDLSDVASQVDSTETTIPDELVLDSQREAAPDAEHEETPEEAAERVRDEKGRFAKKEEEPTPEGQQPTAVKPEATTLPFQYRAMGANHALDGATLDNDGNLIVKAEQVGQIRQALNALHMAQEGTIPVIQERDQKITELTGNVEDLKVLGQTAEAIITQVERAMKEPDDQKALEAFWQLRGGWDALMARAENQFLSAQLQRSRTQPARTAERQPDVASAGMPDVETAQATTNEYLEQAKLDTRFRTLTADDWKQLETRLQRTPYAFLRKATAEEARQYGPIVFDIPAFVQEVTDYHTSLTRQRDTATKRTKLAADNARRTQPSIAAPPTPGGGRQAVGAGAKKGFESEKDVDNWLESDQI